MPGLLADPKQSNDGLRGLRASADAMACSRAPEPMTRTVALAAVFILAVMSVSDLPLMRSFAAEGAVGFGVLCGQRHALGRES
jgi:hypothetical protein